MAKAEFPYTAVQLPASEVYPEGRTAYRPLMKATITASNGESARILVLLDSGADACLFSLDIATQLNLDVLRLPKTFTGGVGSQANLTYYDTVSIDLGDGIQFSAYAAFTQGMNQVGLGLLGQSGFFEHFRVEFLYNQKIFTIEPV